MTEKLKAKINIENIEFIVILILGAFYRFYKLGIYPGGMQRDEATVAMNSLNLFKNGTDFVGNLNPVYFADWGDGHSALYVWLTQIPLLLSGGKMSLFVSRLPQAIVAVVTLICVYLIGKETIGKKFGLFSMVILSMSPWHIMMARWGLDANLAPGFLMIGFLFLVKSVRRERNLILAALFYGLSLYSYACTWVVVPTVLLLTGVYYLVHKKIAFNKTVIIAIIVLFVTALPLMIFVLVNSGFLPDIRLPFISIVGMGGYRGSEVAGNFTEGAIENIKKAAYLLIHQSGAGEPWELILPWGFIYDLGRVLVVIGGVWLFIKGVLSFKKKPAEDGNSKRDFSWEVVFLIQIIAALITCVATYATIHRINVLYIPLIFAGAYGAYKISEAIKAKKEVISKIVDLVVMVSFITLSIFFWKDYTGPEYKTLCEAYWGVGMDECIDTAFKACEENNLKMITVEKAAQWPKFVLLTETLAPEFTSSAVYESYPIPWSFKHKDILIQTRIDYDAITKDSVYIIYFTDYDVFKDDFELTKIYDWYVAVPKLSTTGGN